MGSFKDWLSEQAGDATMMSSGKPGYDQNLQEPEGLAYKKPEIPNFRSKLGEKIDKAFGKQRSKDVAPNRQERK